MMTERRTMPGIDHAFRPLQDGVQLGSMIHFRRIFEHLMGAARPQLICEVGLEGGIVTDYLVGRAEAIGARYVGIDPFLQPSVAARFAGRPGVELVQARSHEALASAECPDFTIIDGDHNHFTVLGELRLLREAWSRGGEKQMLVLMHDTSWPCARRDFYYDREAVPPGKLQPIAPQGGLSILSEELTPHGFGHGEGFDIAAHWGGPRNGVMTALDDFLAETPTFAALHVPAVCGLSVVWPERSLSAPLRDALGKLRDGLDIFSDLLAQLEFNRLHAYDLFRSVQFAPVPADASPASTPGHRSTRARVAQIVRGVIAGLSALRRRG